MTVEHCVHVIAYMGICWFVTAVFTKLVGALSDMSGRAAAASFIERIIWQQDTLAAIAPANSAAHAGGAAAAALRLAINRLCIMCL